MSPGRVPFCFSDRRYYISGVVQKLAVGRMGNDQKADEKPQFHWVFYVFGCAVSVRWPHKRPKTAKTRFGPHSDNAVSQDLAGSSNNGLLLSACKESVT